MNDIWDVLDAIATVWFKVVLFITFPLWFLPAFIYDRIKRQG